MWITPFSNGTDAMVWYANNCDQCKNAYKPESDELPDFAETEELVCKGLECKFKFDLDLGFAIGQIPEITAKHIGYNNKQLSRRCMLFKESSNNN